MKLKWQQWDGDLVEARYIKDLEDNLSIIRLRFGENSKPLFRNREFIVYERRETMDDGTLVRIILKLQVDNKRTFDFFFKKMFINVIGSSSSFTSKRDSSRFAPKAKQCNKRFIVAIWMGCWENWSWFLHGHLRCPGNVIHMYLDYFKFWILYITS